METPGKFYGMGVNDQLTRQLSDETPISFDWSIGAATNIVATVAFDNVNFINCVGEMVALGGGRWQLNYHPQDRPTNAGLITYKFLDNLSNEDILPVEFTGAPITSEEVALKLSEYGPKRIKTKEMEIEQFDPRILDELDERKKMRAKTIPTFCSSNFCAGQTIEENPRCCRD
jgi:hypothetical protein